MQSQQLKWQGRTRNLSISSRQQLDRFPRRRPVGMQAGFAATVLAALAVSLMLLYAMSCALTTRNAYAAMSVRREIDDLKAQNSLLRYQIDLTESSQQIQLAAAQMNLRPAASQEVDYVLLPDSGRDAGVQLATTGPARASAGLAATLAELATEVVGSTRGRAEASTEKGHRP